MPSKRKVEPHLWDDESGEPAPLTPEQEEARLEAALDRMERNHQAILAKNKELEERLAITEAVISNFYATMINRIQHRKP